MAQAKVSQEALVKMAETLRQGAERIMSAKAEMDSQLRSFVWDDPTGYYFTGKYEEDFKPIQTELIPKINDFVKYLSQLDIQVSEFAGTAAIVGVGMGAFYGGERYSNNVDVKKGVGRKPDEKPILKTEERCQFPHTAKEYYDKWAYTTDKNGNQVLKKYPIGPNGKELTAENYREFDKRTLMRSLSYGMGFEYKEEDLGKLKVKDGRVYGHGGRWISGGMIVNERLFTDKNISHENVLEIVFHENQHKIQNEQLSKECLTNVPKGGYPLSKTWKTCLSEIKMKDNFNEVTEPCQKEYEAYRNYWEEVQAREEGEKGRIEAESTVNDALINKKLMKPRVLHRKPN